MDQIIEPVDACFRNARDLVRAAKRVLDDGKLPNSRRSSGRRQDGFHRQSLRRPCFQAFLGRTPNFARGNISREEFEGRPPFGLRAPTSV
jgi:hypothetical protein